MKATNGEIFTLIEPLNKLMGMKLPVKTSLQVVKLIGKLREPMTEVGAVKKSLIQKYGISFEKDGTGGTTIKANNDADIPKYLAEATELANMEVTILAEKIRIPAEVDSKPLQIEPGVLMALEKFIDIV